MILKEREKIRVVQNRLGIMRPKFFATCGGCFWSTQYSQYKADTSYGLPHGRGSIKGVRMLWEDS
jgi:hypothetical protein